MPLHSMPEEGGDEKTSAPKRFGTLVFYLFAFLCEELLHEAQSLGIGLASVLASAAVDALGSHDADVLAVDVAFNDSAGGAFFDALLAEGAQFSIDCIHG